MGNVTGRRRSDPDDLIPSNVFHFQQKFKEDVARYNTQSEHIYIKGFEYILFEETLLMH